jgi:hypothetical protein
VRVNQSLKVRLVGFLGSEDKKVFFEKLLSGYYHNLLEIYGVTEDQCSDELMSVEDKITNPQNMATHATGLNRSSRSP